MRNVIDARDRFRRFLDRQGADHARASLYSTLQGITHVPHDDRAIMASRMGDIASRLSPDHPLDGAKRLFEKAWGGEKWQKRKRLIQLADEAHSSAGGYGAYEASGATWAALAKAAAALLNPHAEGAALEREQERLLRRLLLGTSLLPQHFTLPSEARQTADLIADLAGMLAQRIRKETNLQDLWQILKVSPFTLEPGHPETEIRSAKVDMASLAAKARWGDGALGHFSRDVQRHGAYAYNWSYPIVRIGALRRRLCGDILVPPRHLADALLDPDDGVWGQPGSGPHERRILEWLKQPVVDSDYDPAKGYGWVTMPIETTRSVYLEACPRNDGEIGIWLKVSEPFIDNFIPQIPGADITRIAYEHLGLQPSGEPFSLEVDWTSDSKYRELGILAWPQWCKEFVHDDNLWRGGIIGVRDTEYLILADFAGVERDPHFTCDPPNWFGPEQRMRDENMPDGIGGWLDDTDNQELLSTLFANPDGVSFLPSIAQDADAAAPCRAGTIADALLRNVGCSDEERLDGLMIHQARAYVQAGTQFHGAELDRYRSKIWKIMEGPGEPPPAP